MNKIGTDERQYVLKLPEPIGLWKWAARNSRRADGKPLAVVDFFKRAVRASNPNKGESHEAFVKRALFAELRLLVVERRADKRNIPPWVEEYLAGEIGNQ